MQDITRLEWLTIHGEEHKGTLLHPSLIINRLCSSGESVIRQLGQAPGQLIEPLMEICIVDSQVVYIGCISSEMVLSMYSCMD